MIPSDVLLISTDEEGDVSQCGVFSRVRQHRDVWNGTEMMLETRMLCNGEVMDLYGGVVLMDITSVRV